LKFLGQIKWRFFGSVQDKFDGKREQQIMGGQPKKEGHLPRRRKELRALPQREVSHPSDIDRNTVSENSQRIRRSKDMSGTRDACAGKLPQVSDKERDDQMGKIQTYSQDGREEVCR
jgi:hypothetical protein